MDGSLFDFFVALDGPGLNGFEGPGGIARLRCSPEAGRYEVQVRFFDGLAGGHATQINPSGTIGFLGNLSQQFLFYDPRTLQELKRVSMRRVYGGRSRVFYESPTHVVWLTDTTFVSALGPDFWQFDFHDLDHPKQLGPHGVALPHAVRLSASRRFLFYGAMDHDVHGYANQAGVFDLETGRARLVELDATVWHVGGHPTRDVFYAPTQRCTPQAGREFVEYIPAHFKNYLYEIEVDATRAGVSRHLAIGKDLPGHLTSDIVVTEREVIYDNPASSVITIVDLETFNRIRHIDERVGFWRALRSWRSAFANLLESASRVSFAGNTHHFLKALRISRWSFLDGGYGLQLSPDHRFLLSAHRGLNQVIVYRWPRGDIVRRVRFPPVRRFFPQYLGRLDDTRLGFHHSALSTASVVNA